MATSQGGVSDGRFVRFRLARALGRRFFKQHGRAFVDRLFGCGGGLPLREFIGADGGTFLSAFLRPGCSDAGTLGAPVPEAGGLALEPRYRPVEPRGEFRDGEAGDEIEGENAAGERQQRGAGDIHVLDQVAGKQTSGQTARGDQAADGEPRRAESEGSADGGKENECSRELDQRRIDGGGPQPAPPTASTSTGRV